jgi:hypothetical protein
MYSVSKKRHYVITHAEIIGLFGLFMLILSLLYSKDKLVDRVLEESSNYDLTVIYLENMLRHDPDNEELMLALLKTVQKSGKIDLGIKLADMLKNRNNHAIQMELKGIKYFLLKDQLKNIEAEDPRREKIEEEMIQLLRFIVRRSFESASSFRMWYAEAFRLGAYDDALAVVSKARMKEPGSLYWLKQYYTLGIRLKRDDIIGKALAELRTLDKEEQNKWEEATYYYLVSQKEYDEAEKRLLLLEKISDKWKAEHGKLALSRGYYKKASRLYMEVREDETDSDLRKKWFLKALTALEYGSFLQEAVLLAKSHEDEYINDREMREKFLKLYLAAGDLEAGAKLSNKLLNLDGNQ